MAFAIFSWKVPTPTVPPLSSKHLIKSQLYDSPPDRSSKAWSRSLNPSAPAALTAAGCASIVFVTTARTAALAALSTFAAAATRMAACGDSTALAWMSSPTSANVLLLPPACSIRALMSAPTASIWIGPESGPPPELESDPAVGAAAAAAVTMLCIPVISCKRFTHSAALLAAAASAGVSPTLPGAPAVAAAPSAVRTSCCDNVCLTSVTTFSFSISRRGRCKI